MTRRFPSGSQYQVSSPTPLWTPTIVESPTPLSDLFVAANNLVIKPCSENEVKVEPVPFSSLSSTSSSVGREDVKPLWIPPVIPWAINNDDKRGKSQPINCIPPLSVAIPPPPPIGANRGQMRQPSTTVNNKGSRLIVQGGITSTNTKAVKRSSSDDGMTVDDMAPSTSSPSPSPPLSGSSSSSSNGSNNRFRSYPVKTTEALRSPYQSLPTPGSTLYAYTWRLPDASIMGKLCSIGPTCFQPFDRCIGLLFSQPLMKSDPYVCRIPAYLNRGMVRLRIKLADRDGFQCDAKQLTLLLASHRILSHLLTNLSHPTHSGLEAVDRHLGPLPAPSSSSAKQSEMPNHLVDLFSDLAFNPLACNFLALIAIIDPKTNQPDFEAAQLLIQWSLARDAWTGNPLEFASSDQPVVPHPSGVIPSFPLRLSQVHQEYWSGLLVRPRHLTCRDPGLFAVESTHPELSGLSNVTERILRSYQSQTNQPDLPPNHKLSYVDYYASCFATISELLPLINPSIPLVNCFRLTRHQNATLCMAGLRRSKQSTGDMRLCYLADACNVYPLVTPLWFHLTLLPTVIHQLNRCLSIAAFRASLTNQLGLLDADGMEEDDQPATTVIMPDRIGAHQCLLSELTRPSLFDNEVDAHWTDRDDLANDIRLHELIQSRRCHVPSSHDLFEATTAITARDVVNLERLEIMGDSLIQLLTSLTVFTSSESAVGEGILTSYRMSLVSNMNLALIAFEREWYNYLTSRSFDPDQFVPPLFVPPSPELPLMVRCSSDTSYDPRSVSLIPEKTLADMVEAVAGCFLVRSGFLAACRLLGSLKLFNFSLITGTSSSKTTSDAMSIDDEGDRVDDPEERRWIGLLTSSDDSVQLDMLDRCSDCDWLPAASPGTLTDNCDDLRRHNVECILGYHFKDPSLLTLALTHRSAMSSSGSYERLEFLGDAVLEFIVTNYLFKIDSISSPGHITTLRSGLVSNVTLALVIVELRLHQWIQHELTNLSSIVDRITEVIDHFKTAKSKQYALLDKLALEGLKIKPLADIFESLVGAVFCDTRGDLILTTQLVYRLLGSRISDYRTDPPVNLMRKVHVLYPKLKYLKTNEGNQFKVEIVGADDFKSEGVTRNQARLNLLNQLSNSSQPQ